MSFIKPESELSSVAMDVSPLSTSALDSTSISDPTPPENSTLPNVNSTESSQPEVVTDPAPATSELEQFVEQSPSFPLSSEHSITSNSNEANNNNSSTSIHSTNKPNPTTTTTTSPLERGPLGLTVDEEQWVKEKMEYALYE